MDPPDALLLPSNSVLIGWVKRICDGAVQVMQAERFAGMLLLALAAAVAVAGCASSLGTQLPFGGLPPDAPSRAAVQPAYPQVYDIPPARETKLATEQEQAAIEAELAALRKKLNARADALEREGAGSRR